MHSTKKRTMSQLRQYMMGNEEPIHLPAAFFLNTTVASCADGKRHVRRTRFNSFYFEQLQNTLKNNWLMDGG